MSIERLNFGNINTLVPENLALKEWDLISAGQATPAVSARQLIDPGTGAILRTDMVRVNRQQAAPTSGKKVTQFVAPPGCTEVVFEVEAALPDSLTGQSIVIGLYALDGTTLLSKTTCALTAKLQLFQTAPVAVVPGTEYRCVIHFHNTGEGTTSQATAFIGRCAVVPTKVAGPSLFGNIFTRIHMKAALLHDNRASSIVSRRQEFSPFSRLVFETSAERLAAEYIRVYQDATNDCMVYVNGEPWKAFTLIGATYGMALLDLPPGHKVVEIWMPGYANTATYPAAPVVSTAAINAIYVEGTDIKIVLPTTSTRRLVVYGDSIASGKGAAQWAAGGLAALLRRSYPGSVCVEAWGSRSLAEDCGTAASPALDSAAKRIIFANIMAAWNPTDIASFIGTNDYGGSYWSAATFGTVYGSMLDDIHAKLPHARVYAWTPFKRASEVANGLGDTLGAYRTALNALAAARASWLTVVDGSGIPAAATTGVNAAMFDTVHPNENGHALIFESVRANIVW